MKTYHLNYYLKNKITGGIEEITFAHIEDFFDTQLAQRKDLDNYEIKDISVTSTEVDNK